MRRTDFQKIFGWLVLISLLTGCSIPSLSPPPVPVSERQSMDPLGTIIAETAAAAQTQTQTALPTSTSTPTATRTATITPTPTATFLFLITTDTLTPTPTNTLPPFIPTLSDDDEENGKFVKPIFTGKPWSCRGMGKYPPNNTIFKPSAPFTARWILMNTGTKLWTINTIDLVYTGGYRHENTKIQDFTRNVATGGQITVTADFIAPKASGEYSSFFTLMVGNRRFCGMAIFFAVEGK